MATLTDEVYQGLKLRIVQLRMPPGASFTEAELAAELGVSKTPVREALGRLQRQGLVEVVPRLGYRVAPVTLKDTRDLFALRTILEAEAAATAAMRCEESGPLRELERLCQASYRPDDPTSIQEFLRTNTRLHLTVAEIGGNERLVRALREILDQSERLFHLGLALSFRSSEIVHEHSDLVGAIIAGDSARAREISLGQSHSSQKMVMEALLSSQSVLETNVLPLRQSGASR
jgi:DNA-binding GntR family transcriptional regulator